MENTTSQNFLRNTEKLFLVVMRYCESVPDIYGIDDESIFDRFTVQIRISDEIYDVCQSMYGDENLIELINNRYYLRLKNIRYVEELIKMMLRMPTNTQKRIIEEGKYIMIVLPDVYDPEPFLDGYDLEEVQENIANYWQEYGQTIDDLGNEIIVDLRNRILEAMIEMVAYDPEQFDDDILELEEIVDRIRICNDISELEKILARIS